MASTRRSILITALVAGSIFLVIVGATAFFFLRVVSDAGSDTVPVTVVAQVGPRPDGVEVRMTVTAVRGNLPEFFAPETQWESTYLTKAADRSHASAEGRISELTIDGIQVSPGQRITPKGQTAEVSFVVDRRSDGRRVAWIPGRLKGLDPTSVTVSASEAPVTCLVPEGQNAIDDGVWFTECPTFPVTAVDGPALKPGYSDIDIVATVRIAYDPPRQ